MRDYHREQDTATLMQSAQDEGEVSVGYSHMACGGENATEVRYKQRRGTGFRREDEGNECPDE